MATEQQLPVIPSWLHTDEHLRQGPEDASPEKLAPFCDGWIHLFTYRGDYYPGAVYRCKDKITSWGVEWKKDNDGRVRIVPKLQNGTTAHPQTGLNILEMQGLSDAEVLLVIEEKIPKTERSRIYGLVLDYSDMDLALCKSCTELGLLMSKDDLHTWTPRQMEIQWGLIEEARQDANPSTAIVVAPATTPSPKKKSKKRKALVGAPGDEDEEGVKLTIARCVQMNEAEVKKLSPKDIKVMKALYKSTFDCMYKWGKKAFVDADGQLMRVHFDYLHKGPPGSLVYRGIEPSRLDGIIRQARLDTDYNLDHRVITVLPIKLGPYGPDGKATYYDTCPKTEFIRKDAHYFIIGGQHTVEAYKVLVQKKEIPECDVQNASSFCIIPIFAPRSKFTDVMFLSRALNQNVAGEQKEQCFTKQLLNARTKWREMGSPQPAFGGRAHSSAYSEFSDLVPTFFTNVKGNELTDPKIPLIFLENDADVNKWIEIEADYLSYKLPGSEGPMGDTSKAVRKPLTIFDFKPLYGIRVEDINYLAELVKTEEICVKSSKAKNRGIDPSLLSLHEAGTREKAIRVMKNEMMCHYRKFYLPSKRPEYVPYTEAEWEEFATEKKIGRSDLQLWIDKAMATEAGKKWFHGRSKALNKTHDPADCPKAIHDMWDILINAKAEVVVEEAMEKGFAENYLSKTMDEHSWNISGILAQPDVIAWRGMGKRHMYIWYMFEASKSGPRAKFLEDRKLRRLFDALECTDERLDPSGVRSPAIIITDAQGFHDVVAHLYKRKLERKTRLWDWHLVHYFAGPEDGFPEPAAGIGFGVFGVFCFGYSDNESARSHFKYFFYSEEPIGLTYEYKDMGQDVDTSWRRRGMPYLRANTALELFSRFMKEDMVLVNVNGGPEITHVGVSAQVKVLEVFYLTEAKTTGQSIVKKMVEDISVTSRQIEGVEVEEQSAESRETPPNPEDTYSEHSEHTENEPIILEADLPPVEYPEPKKLKNSTPKKRKAVQFAEEPSAKRKKTSKAKKDPPTAKNRKKAQKPEKNKRTAAHLVKQNLSAAFTRADETIAHASDSTQPEGISDIAGPVDIVNEDDNVAASLLLSCAAHVAVGEGSGASRPELHESGRQTSSANNSRGLQNNIPRLREVILQLEKEKGTLPSEDLPMDLNPVSSEAMSDTICNDTLADLPSFSPERVRPTKLSVSQKLGEVDVIGEKDLLIVSSASNKGEGIHVEEVLRANVADKVVDVAEKPKSDAAEEMGGDMVISKDCIVQASSNASVPQQVPRRQYCIVLDLNGVLVHRIHHRNNPTIKRRPGLTKFLDWLFSKAQIIIWSSMTYKNMKPMIEKLCLGASFSPGLLTCLSQLDCTESSYKNPEMPSKPYFLKDLSTLVSMKEVDSLENVLLIDDSPYKNLLNGCYSAIHPETWLGEGSDTFLDTCLRPWLNGLLMSNEAVPDYVQANPLLGSQVVEDRVTRTSFGILKGCVPRE